MAFIRPAALVYQEFLETAATTTIPFFSMVIVGPAYQVQRNVACAKYWAPDVTAKNYSTNYIGQIDTTKIDVSFTAVNFKSTDFITYPLDGTLATQGTISTVGGVTTLTLAAGALPADVRAGVDLVDVMVSGKVTTSSIMSIDGTRAIITLQSAVAGTGACSAVFYKRDALNTYAIPAVSQSGSSGFIASASSVELTKGIKLSMLGDTTQSTRLVYRAIPSIKYRALRSDLARQPIAVTNFTSAIQKIGSLDLTSTLATPLATVDPDNPMAVAMQVVESNMSGLEYSIVCVEEDNDTGYLSALNTVDAIDNAYCLVPLTQSLNVITAFGKDCLAMSTPLKSKWRVTYANCAQPATHILYAPDINTGMYSREDTESPVIVQDVVGGAFILSGVVAGDFIEFYDVKATVPEFAWELGATQLVFKHALKIKSVLSDNVVTCYPNIWTKLANGTYSLTPDVVPPTIETSFTYRATESLAGDTDKLTAAMCAIAKSLNNNRIRLIQPDEVTMMLDDGSGQGTTAETIMPGYYIAVAYAALRAGFPPHQGFTNYGVSGFTTLRHANYKFTNSQIDTMAGAGIFWVIQTAAGALPYCVYQTTTAQINDSYSKEDSVIATVDYASLAYRDNLQAVVGVYNVNTMSLNTVGSIIDGVTDRLKRTIYPYIGPILLDGKLQNIASSGTTIAPYISIKVPFPVNWVEVHLQVGQTA